MQFFFGREKNVNVIKKIKHSSHKNVYRGGELLKLESAESGAALYRNQSYILKFIFLFFGQSLKDH